jgi:hypothetical protein
LDSSNSKINIVHLWDPNIKYNSLFLPIVYINVLAVKIRWPQGTIKKSNKEEKKEGRKFILVIIILGEKL